jgi:N-acetylneuraminate synthase
MRARLSAETYDFDRVVGKRLLRAVRRNQQLKWGDLG